MNKQKELNFSEIAIIGMSGRFPQAANLDEYWENLINGKDCISEVPGDRFDVDDYFLENGKSKNKINGKWGGFLKDAFDFDPQFFNISSIEAPALDPQQRKILEVAYEAIEDAGYDETDLAASSTGVFLGIMGRGYYDNILKANNTLEAHLFTSSLFGFIANRISYHLNLTGPSLSIDTLCSSSLVTTHYACMSILAGECDQALAGGVYVNFSAEHYALLSSLNVLSKDGRCKSFDESANGIVSGEGAGLILLKRLDRALEDGDHIHAVIKKTIVNNDGRSSRFTATNPAAQESMLQNSYEQSGISPETIQFIETHGTGTALGDPIELSALKKVFSEKTKREAFCALGSVKSNIGHLEPAAGIASLIKSVLAIKNKVLPPTLHVKKINHYINLVQSPFIIADKPVTLSSDNGPVRGGINSFGMGGTNAHIILEEAPEMVKKTKKSKKSGHIFMLSARTIYSLKTYIRRFLDHIEQFPGESVENLCYTAVMSRRLSPHKICLTCKDLKDLSSQLTGMLKSLEENEDASTPERPEKPEGLDGYAHIQKVRQKIVFDLTGNWQEKGDTKNLHPSLKKSLTALDKKLKAQKSKKLFELLNSREEKEQQLGILLYKYLFLDFYTLLGLKPDMYLYDDVSQNLTALISGAVDLDTFLKDNTGKKPVSYEVRDQKLFVNKKEQESTGGKSRVKLITINLAGHCKLSLSKAGYLPIYKEIYLMGLAINVKESIYAQESLQRISLPTYPFDQKRYVYQIEETEESRLTPFLHTFLCKSMDNTIYETVIDENLYTYFKDHTVLGSPILPGAAYFEMALSAIKQHTGAESAGLKEIVLTEPIHVRTGVKIHVQLKTKPGGLSFKIGSLAPSESKWKTHCFGKAEINPEPSGPALEIEQVKKNMTGQITEERLKDYFLFSGIEYGPAFWVIKDIETNENSILARLTLADDVVSRSEGIDFHPSLVDAALQSVLGFVVDGRDADNKPYYPYSIKNIACYKQVSKECHSIVTLNEASPLYIKADIQFVSDGQLLAEIKGLVLKRAAERAETDVTAGLFYEIAWNKTPEVPGSSGKNQRLLVFSGESKLENDTLEGLKKNGHTVISARAGKTFKKTGEDGYQLDVLQYEDYKKLFEAVLPAKDSLDGIVLLWPLDSKKGADRGLKGLFLILKTIINEYRFPHNILVLTDSTQQVVPGEEKVNPDGAELWGLVQNIPIELPFVNFSCNDVDAENSTGSGLAALIGSEFEQGFKTSLSAVRKGTKYSRSIEKRHQIEQISELPYRKDGVYLITGGLGGIGLSLAEYLVYAQDATVVLLSRTPLSEKKEQIKHIIDSCNKNKKRVYTFAVDILDEKKLKELAGEITKTVGQVNGIYHAAGVLKDSLIKDKSLDDFANVVAIKRDGAKALCSVYKDSGLDFIVYFSSMVSLLGNVGQSDYVSANAFLDSLGCANPVNAGKSLTIAWSFWRVGMGYGLEKLALQKGYKTMEPATAIEAMNKALRSGYNQIMIADRTKDLQGEQKSPKTVKSGPARKESIDYKDYLAGKLAALLELSKDDIDYETSFTEFGIDSILATKIASILNEEVNLEIDSTILFDYPNIYSLADYLDEQSGGLSAGPADEGQESEIVFNLEQLSDENEQPVQAAISGDSLSEALLKQLAGLLASALGISADDIDYESSFIEFGMDSFLATSFIAKIAETFGIELSPTLVFDYPNLTDLVEYLIEESRDELQGKVETGAGTAPAQPAGTSEPQDSPEVFFETLEFKKTEPVQTETVLPASEPEVQDNREPAAAAYLDDDIAVIGMAGRFPGAENLNRFWENLKNGVGSTNTFPEERIDPNLEIYQGEDFLSRKDRLFGNYLHKIDEFDPLFFEISPQEAELMDPQQRILLEVAYEAIENAGYGMQSLSNTKTAVYIGACITEYAKLIDELDARAGTGNENSILANRISYFLNLKGPSLTVNTACSSSLVALDLGCKSLRAKTCEMAIVGGVNLIVTPWYTIVFDKAGMLSDDGKCKTFDASANGYARGEGAGVVLLKPLKKALADNDNIIGVIKGSETNQDGRTNGITAPNTLSQEQVIKATWESSHINPESLSLIEAHGTGTSLGDPIEVKGLTNAFREFTGKNAFCAIGSVKSNIGHLEGAAGISGIIKILLCLKHKKLVPSLNFNKLNPLIKFETSPFYVCSKYENWNTEADIKRRAAISSFGFGGTNAHVVLEEGPEQTDVCEGVSRPYHLLCFSAKNEEALEQEIRNTAALPEESLTIADAAFTLLTGRDFFSHRKAFIVEDFNEFKMNSSAPGEQGLKGIYKAKNKPKTAFFFDSEQKSWDHARELFKRWPPFQESINNSIDMELKLSGKSNIKEWLMGDSFEGSKEKERAFSTINFAVNCALYHLYSSWGLSASYISGTGTGLLAVFYAAQTVTLEEVFKSLAFNEQQNLLDRCFKSQAEYAIPVFDPATGFAYKSNLPEYMINPVSSLNSEYEKSDKTGYDKNNNILLIEMGQKNPALHEFILNKGLNGKVSILSTIQNRFDEYYSILVILANLFIQGIDVQWNSIFAPPYGKRIPLPAYPFQRRSYWLTKKAGHRAAPASALPVKTDYPFKLLTDSWEAVGQEKLDRGKAENKVFLLFKDDLGIADSVRTKLSEQNNRFIEVTKGDYFSQTGTDSFSIDIESPADYTNLLQTVLFTCKKIDGILFLWPAEKKTDILKNPGLAEKQLNSGLYALFLLAQALIEKKMQNLRLLTLTSGGFSFKPGDYISPAHKAAAIFSTIMPYEIKGLETLTIDTDPETADFQQLAALMANTFGPGPADNSRNKKYIFRDNNLYVHTSKETDPGSLQNQTLIQPGSRIVITGGAGGIGFELARHFLQTQQVSVVLLGRTFLPPEESWPSIINDAGADKKIKNSIERIKTLQAEGKGVKYINCDITNPTLVEKVFKQIKAEMGKIDLVFHCAGVIDSQNISIGAKSLTGFKNILKPKVQGSLNLASVCLGDGIESMDNIKVIYFSSLSTLSGENGIGFSDYACANGFMEGLAQLQLQQKRASSMVISWPVWEKTGMSLRGLVTKKGHSLAKDECLEALDLLTGKVLDRPVYIAGQKKAEEKSTPVTPAVNETPAPGQQSLQPVSPEQEQEESAATDTVDKLKVIISGLLKMAPHEIEIDVDFSEYGMDSISIGDLMGKIEAGFGEHLDPSSILEYPNIETLAEFIDRKFGITGKITPAVEKQPRAEQIEQPEQMEQQKETPGSSGTLQSSTDLLKELYEGNITVDEVLEKLKKAP